MPFILFVTHFHLQGLKKEEGYAKYEYNVTQGHLMHFCWKESGRIEKNARCCGGRGGCNEIYSIR